MSKEIELKLRCHPSHADTLAGLLDQHAQAQPTLRLNNTYFDTPSCELARSKAALRIRQQGEGQYEQTLKTAGRSQGGLHQRGEWNWSLDSEQLDISLLSTPEVQAHWPADIEVASLAPCFSTDFERRVWLWQQGGDEIEIVLDQGTVSSDQTETSLPLCEVELELKQGDAAQLWILAEQLTQACPLWLSNISKAERGYQLIGQSLGQPSVQSSKKEVIETLTPWCRQQLQQHLDAFIIALEKGLWQQDSASALQAWQHWLVLRHLPQWCGKVIKRKETQAFRQALDTFKEPLLAWSALTTADRFMNDGTLRASWLAHTEQTQQQAELGQALLKAAHWLYDWSITAPDDDESTEHFLLRQWKDLSQSNISPSESWQWQQWGDALPSSARGHFFYGARAMSENRRQQRLWDDMVNGQTVLHYLQQTSNSSLPAESLQQALPYELAARWQQITF